MLAGTFKGLVVAVIVLPVHTGPKEIPKAISVKLMGGQNPQSSL